MRLRTAAGASLLVVALALAATNATQPLNVKLGLWQMTYTTESDGTAAARAVPGELLAKMTPEQRSRTEARLKARAGEGPRIETKRYCLTQERLSKAIFNSEASQTCQRTMTASTAKLQQFHEECIQSGRKRLADGRFEAVDFSTMKGVLKVKDEGSTPFSMNLEIAGKWIGTDCGETAQ